MSWDLGISEHGDLVVTGHRDLAGKSGTDLLEQRMVIRLKVMKGSWIYDDGGDLGSNLHNVIGADPTKAGPTIIAYAREALRPITEISVKNIQVMQDGNNLILIVFYLPANVNPDTAPQQFQMTLPLAGGGA